MLSVRLVLNNDTSRKLHWMYIWYCNNSIIRHYVIEFEFLLGIIGSRDFDAAK